MRPINLITTAVQKNAADLVKKTFIAGFLCSILSIIAFGQGAENTSNTADQSMRSSGRVNSSTLGMEFDLGLRSYSGRGISLPLGLNYSSKQWRIEEQTTIPQANGNIKTWSYPLYSEEAAAGWTSTLSQPVIEYTGEKYRFQSAGQPLSLDEVIPPGTPPHSGESYIKRITVFLPGGGAQELRAQDAPIALSNDELPAESVWNTTFYATDGSGLKYVQDSSTSLYRLYMPDGSFYDFNSTRENKSSTDWMKVRYGNRLTDVHGNYVQFNTPTTTYPNGSWTDQLGRTFPVMIPRRTPEMPSGESVLTQSFTLPGMSAAYVFKWKKLKGSTAANSAFTDFYNQVLHYPGAVARGQSTGTYSPPLFWAAMIMGQCGGATQLPYAATPYPFDIFNPVVLTDIILPNGAAYTFSYDEYGEVERINYPTGGREEITYGEVPSLAELTGLYKKANRGVTERKIYESSSDVTPTTWAYSAEASKNNYRTSTIGPDGTQIDRLMHRGAPPPTCAQQTSGQYYGTKHGYDNVLAGMIYEERVFSSATPKHILQRTLTKWTSTASTTLVIHPSTYLQRNLRAHSKEVTIFDGDAGLAVASKLEYDTDVDDLGSSQNVIRTKEYAYRVVSGGNSFSAGGTPPDTAVIVPDLTASATLVRITERDFLNTSTDSNLAALKTACATNNLRSVMIASRILNAAGTTIISQSKITYDENGYSPAVGRGLPTSVYVWDSAKGSVSSPGNYLVTHTTFDAYGNQTATTDSKGNTTTRTYDPTYHAFPEIITTPAPGNGTYGSSTALTSVTTFDSTTGLPLEVKDPNEKITTMEYDDPLLRPTNIILPNGQQTITEYGQPGSDGRFSDGERFVKVRSQIDETRWSEAGTWSDGLGRAIKTQKIDSDGDIFSDIEYDNMGRVKKASNPYKAGETVLQTETFYDDLDRVTKIKTPDTAEAKTTFGLATSGSQIGTVVTIEDQAGKLRRSIADARGRLLRVDEPTDAGGLGTISSPNQPTYYGYDLIGNLTTITQGVQTRTFTLSSLSRLLSSVNPESGTINYQYDNNGNLTQKSQSRSGSVTITTTFTYDALNRLIQKSYSGDSAYPTPTVNHYYDNLTNAKGKLIKIYSSVSTTEYTAFDIMGRPTAHKQTTGGTNYTTAYSYNLSGTLIEETYPSTRKVKNILDDDGALAIVQGKKNSTAGYWNYADSFIYNSGGAITTMQLGNGHWQSTQFNSRLQHIQIALGKTINTADIFKIDYSYGTAGNNGDLQSQTITVPGVGAAPGFTAVQNYTYDSLNRLKQADEKPLNYTATDCNANPGKCWKQAFTYDLYGTRNFDEANTTTLTKSCGSSPNYTVCPADRKVENPEIVTSNNRIKGDQDGDHVDDYTFDLAGNTLKSADGLTYIYDGENKQIEVWNASSQLVGQYYYDGSGKRVKKVVPSTGETTIFVYNASGKMVAEYSTVLSATPQVNYLTNDHLGSPRINTDQNGAVIARHDYYPFGEEINSTGGRTTVLGYAGDNLRNQFTGYERDRETDLDFAQARMYSSSLGRFLVPDPLITSGSAENPQTWNRYTYVGNNPLNITDPLGLSWYYNGRLGQYKWFDDNQPVEDGYKIVVGNNGGAGSFSYQAVDGTWISLDPYSSNYQTRIATREDAIKLTDRLYKCTPDIREWSAGFNKHYDTHMTIITVAMIVDIAIIAAPVLADLAIGGGSAATTLGLAEETGTAAATTAPVVANTAVDAAVEAVMRDPNKINHIFGKAGHGFAPLVQQLGGQANVIRAVVDAVSGSLPVGATSITSSVLIQGVNIQVTGVVINGVIRIGSMWIPK